MTRKPSARPAATSPQVRRVHGRASGRGGTLLGIFIGLVLGLGLAAGVAYYVTKANAPYAAQAAKELRDPVRDAGKPARSDTAAADKPRFDFYKILPGGDEPKVQAERKALPDRAVVDQAKEKEKDKEKDKEKEKDKGKEAERAPTKVASVEPASKSAAADTRFWLQAGSFANESDAENLKAQLALAGWEAAVQQGTVPDKGIRFRVRLGPYDNTDELNRIKADLSRKGFDVAVIKF
ncbi:MAG TPA: SPOR domain-containing protein [Casimicrobiaceae bacterium]|nr:SPOR domain-containing protein [Casimicrobiaceae bacterium]